ncbi:MAG: NAD(P)-dependent oxidoreductase [Euryarchaeota archaeon]|nr:NAD(P)-dependent oxidoreductase [Euryarchaeota archaeon]
MKTINILVTGGAGYIGSCLIPELLKKHDVKILDNLTYGYYGLLPNLGNSNFEFFHGDIRDTKDIENALKNIDLVIHLAALVGYPACKAQPKLAKEINHLATKKLVKYCKVPIVFASTGSCYGPLTEVCTENSPLKPATEYSKTKIDAEREIRKCDDFIIYRFSTGFGLSLRPRLDLLVNDFVIKAVKNKELIIYEKDYWRSFVHVRDIVRSFLFALDHFDEMNHEIYNVGSEELCLTKKDVALAIKKYVDFHLKFAQFGTDPDKRNYKVSFQKIRDLGFKTKYSLDDGIKELIQASMFIDHKKEYYNDKVFK